MPERRADPEKTRETVSVILPYYNRAETLERAVRSVLNQTHSDLRLYLVDDASTDSSASLARSLDDDRIVHIAADANGGAGAARNLGLSAAATDLIAFQDSDDEWLPEKLERQVRHLRTLQAAGQHISVVGCGWRYAHATGSARAFREGPFTHSDMLQGVAGTGTPMLLVDRAAAAAGAEFDLSFRSLEERDFVLSCLANGSQLSIVSQELALVTRGRRDHLANPEKAAEAWERYLIKYARELAGRGELLSWYHFRAAREHLVAGHRGRARGHVRAALRYHRGRRLIHLALGELAGVKGLAVAQKVVPL